MMWGRSSPSGSRRLGAAMCASRRWSPMCSMKTMSTRLEWASLRLSFFLAVKMWPSTNQRPLTCSTARGALAALTDGSNLYGDILPVRQWVEELARRHDLVNERPLVAAELNRRYARQKIMLQVFIWLTVLLVVGIGFIILIGRTRRIRQVSRIKERFAADLHDELGANLHTIGLLSDLSKELIHSPDKLGKLLDRIRIFTERSGTAARYCTNMLEAKGICEDLVDEMERSSRRLLSDLDYQIAFSGEDSALKPRVRIDIFLFFKECLVNILRHSGATKVSILLVATPKDICLTVTDNGHGIDSGQDQVPASIDAARGSSGPVSQSTRPKAAPASACP